MEPLSLLRQARECGLQVFADGERLVVRGPRQFEWIARDLLDQKQEVMDLLWLESISDPAGGEGDQRLLAAVRPIAEAASRGAESKEDWFLALRAGRKLLLRHADLIAGFARARWGDCADGWPVEILAGFYVLDLLAGLEQVLGSWDGWERVRRRLRDRPPRALVPAIWHAFAELSGEDRRAVLAHGDPGQSPPGCLRLPGESGGRHDG